MEQFLYRVSDPLSVPAVLANLGIGAVLGFILRWHFSTFAAGSSQRAGVAQTFPFVLLTTVLIISVVQTSLALSLGLVGALSIVRFRTPVKEPEDLAYLFLAIAMGVGLGANQRVLTAAAGLVILAVMGLVQGLRRRGHRPGLYLSLDWAAEPGGEDLLDRLDAFLQAHTQVADLRRYRAGDGRVEAIYQVDLRDAGARRALLGGLGRQFPALAVSLIDQSARPVE